MWVQSPPRLLPHRLCPCCPAAFARASVTAALPSQHLAPSLLRALFHFPFRFAWPLAPVPAPLLRHCGFFLLLVPLGSVASLCLFPWPCLWRCSPGLVVLLGLFHCPTSCCVSSSVFRLLGVRRVALGAVPALRCSYLGPPFCHFVVPLWLRPLLPSCLSPSVHQPPYGLCYRIVGWPRSPIALVPTGNCPEPLLVLVCFCPALMGACAVWPPGLVVLGPACRSLLGVCVFTSFVPAFSSVIVSAFMSLSSALAFACPLVPGLLLLIPGVGFLPCLMLRSPHAFPSCLGLIALWFSFFSGSRRSLMSPCCWHPPCSALCPFVVVPTAVGCVRGFFFSSQVLVFCPCVCLGCVAWFFMLFPSVWFVLCRFFGSVCIVWCCGACFVWCKGLFFSGLCVFLGIFVL